MTRFQVSDHALRSVQLRREEEDGEDRADSTREILAAAADLSRGWLEPLGVAIRIECRDPDDPPWPAHVRPAEPHHFLRAAGAPAAVVEDVGFTDARVREVAELDAAAIAVAVAEATGSRCPSGHVASFVELIVTAARARLPEASVVAMDGRHELEVHIESRDGIAWASGPTGGRATAPLRLRASVEGGLSLILLSIRWSIWVDLPAIVEEAIGRVLARGRGWSVDE